MAVTQISSGAWRPQVRRRGVHWNWGANETLLVQARICQAMPAFFAAARSHRKRRPHEEGVNHIRCGRSPSLADSCHHDVLRS